MRRYVARQGCGAGARHAGDDGAGMGSGMPGGVLDPPLRRALEAWLAARPAGGGLPPVGSLDPERLPFDLLPHLAMCSGFLPGGRLRAGFVGSISALFAGGTATGAYLDDLYPPASYARVESYFRAIEAARAPLRTEDAFGRAGTPLLRVRRVGLPLADPGGQVGQFAVATVYEPTEAGRRERVRMFQPDLELLSRVSAALAV